VTAPAPRRRSPEHADPRRALADARRIVVKVGSRALVPETAAAAAPRFGDLAAGVAALTGPGRVDRGVVLVSSGAIVLGRRLLGWEDTGASPGMARLQAAAAVGQGELMAGYGRAFDAHGRRTAQLLLTHADLEDRERFRNARNAVDALLELGVVPVVNENDTVAVDEIRFGDNDQLAAMVANLVGADLLVLLTNVDGLRRGGPEGERIPLVDADDLAVDAHVDGRASAGGTGGMGSKLAAARRAADRGIPVVIAPATPPDVLPRLVAGDDVGTLVLPRGLPLASRKHWIAHTLRPRGTLLVDAGAARALQTGRSLLPAGLVGVSGSFDAGDAVAIRALPDHRELGRGLARYALADAARLAGARTEAIARRLGRAGTPELVHADDLVLWTRDEPGPEDPATAAQPVADGGDALPDRGSRRGGSPGAR